MKTLIAVLFISLSSGSFACGNEYGHNLRGEMVHGRFFYFSTKQRTFDKEYLRARLKTLEVSPNADTDFKIQSDIALYHMKLGDVTKALSILKPLYEAHPEEYSIVANLGTAYELNGELNKALKFIQEGLALNPKSHFGSEWIHVKILEAKIKEKNSPGWLSKNSILDIEDLKNASSRMRRGMRENHLEYQLRTRVPFTPAPNKVMANLLETLAKYHVKYGSYENAIAAYTYVLEFTESFYKKKQISNDIIELNDARRESGVKDLNPMFMRLIKDGQIDPKLMMYGINEIADKLYEEDLALQVAQDSIRIMTAKIDSLSSTSNAQQNTKKEKKPNSGMNWGILIGVLGLISGAVIAFIAVRKKNK